MDRRTEVLKFATHQSRGIEIAPWHSPLLPKSQGYDVYTLDVLPYQQLIERAHQDPSVSADMIANIENVDIVGNAIDIAPLAEKAGIGPSSLDFVISSHNFEHIPDPIRFLQGVSQLLQQGGVLSMVMPDRRVSIDHYMPHTITADWLEAYFECRRRPTAKQVFASASLYAHYERNGKLEYGCDIDEPPFMFRPREGVDEAFRSWQEFEKNPDDIYRDTHLWFFTPASLELMLRDLRFFGVINFEIMEIVPPTPDGCSELYVHLCNDNKPDQTSHEEFYRRRRELMARIEDESARNTRLAYAMFLHINELKSKNVGTDISLLSHPDRAEFLEILKDTALDHPLANFSGMTKRSPPDARQIQALDTAITQLVVQLYMIFLRTIVSHPEMASDGKILDSENYSRQMQSLLDRHTFTQARSLPDVLRHACAKSGLNQHVDIFTGCVCTACADQALRNGKISFATEALHEALSLNPSDAFALRLVSSSSPKQSSV